MMNNRTFGVEIELTGLTIVQAATALRTAGFATYDAETRSMGPVSNKEPVVIPPYPAGECGCNSCRQQWSLDHGYRQRPVPSNALIKSSWRVVGDGSVSNGCEVVSPILSGTEGLNILRGVVRALKAAGASVDNSCGFHVHVGAQDLEGPEVINAVNRYARHEAQIDGFMAPRRRESRSQWCRTMTEVASTMATEGCFMSPTGLTNIVNGRYYKLNVHAYVRHGTLEFRQHAGTLNISKMIHWIIFAVTFVETSRLSPEILATFRENAEIKQLEKLARMISDNPRGERLYPHYVAAKMGVQQPELEQLFEKLIRKYPEFRGLRHDAYNGIIRLPVMESARLPLESTASPALPEALDAFEGLPEATVAHLQSRAAGYRSAAQRRADRRDARRAPR